MLNDEIRIETFVLVKKTTTNNNNNDEIRVETIGLVENGLEKRIGQEVRRELAKRFALSFQRGQAEISACQGEERYRDQNHYFDLYFTTSFQWPFVFLELDLLSFGAN